MSGPPPGPKKKSAPGRRHEGVGGGEEVVWRGGRGTGCGRWTYTGILVVFLDVVLGVILL